MKLNASRMPVVLCQLATSAALVACGGASEESLEHSGPEPTASDDARVEADNLRRDSTRPVVPVTPSAPNGGESWTFCAPEHERCTFTGTQKVRYGSGSTYVSLTATDGTDCTNGVFGDPVYGVLKHCDVYVGAATPTPAPAPVP